jgi:hypothetical protein
MRHSGVEGRNVLTACTNMSKFGGEWCDQCASFQLIELRSVRVSRTQDVSYQE